MSVNWHWSPDVWLWVFFSIKLKLSPVIVDMGREGGVWMGIDWHWSSNVWLWVFFSTKLNLSPVVMDEGGECGVWVSIDWHWSSDIWLWVLFQLNESSWDLIQWVSSDNIVMVVNVIWWCGLITSNLIGGGLTWSTSGN